MKQFQEMLYDMAVNSHGGFTPEDARSASDLYEASKNMSDDELAIFVADNDEKLRKVLGISENFPESFRKEYSQLYTQGRDAFVDTDTKLRASGKPKNIDDFMKAFKLTPEEGGFSREDRGAFTNPNSPSYWDKRSADDKGEAALTLGYANVEDMERDLNQQAVDLQHNFDVEGYSPNGGIQPGSYILSSVEGLVFPRIKEAELARREVTMKDILGDAAELGLNFIPGVGFFNKSGKLVARLAGGAIESLAVPLGTNLYDYMAYSDDDMNPRGEFDPTRVLAQAGGVATAKGLLKGYGMVAKNSVEAQSGGEAGKGFRKAVNDAIDNLNTKTDATIAKRELALQRRAEMAKQKKYELDEMKQRTKASVDDNYVINPDNPDDIINYDNYRILKERANAEAARKKSGIYSGDVIPEDEVASRKMYNRTDDGRYVYRNNGYFTEDGKWVPEGSEVAYRAPQMEKVRVDVDKEYPGKDVLVRYPDEMQMVEDIKMYPELRTVAEKPHYRRNEILRDAGAHAVYNTLTREGVVGQLADLDKKREIAMWNKGVRKWREFANNPDNHISPELKKRYTEAFINIHNYGVDSLPENIWQRDPEVYKNAMKMIYPDIEWPHKVPDVPTTSNSTKR